MTDINNELMSSKTTENVSPASTAAYEFSLFCAACGTEALRGNAKFCFTCGKLLKEDYQPLDTLRASYRLQGKDFPKRDVRRSENPDLFQREENNFAETAWASCVYSMVPYLGILFIPFTLVFAFFGIGVSYRHPHLGGRKISVISFGLSFGILLFQILLWALLYYIPKLTTGV